MYNNETAGSAFEEFLDLLGQRVRLKGFNKYRAQLDHKSEYCKIRVCLLCLQYYSCWLTGSKNANRSYTWLIPLWDLDLHPLDFGRRLSLTSVTHSCLPTTNVQDQKVQGDWLSSSRNLWHKHKEKFNAKGKKGKKKTSSFHFLVMVCFTCPGWFWTKLKTKNSLLKHKSTYVAFKKDLFKNEFVIYLKGSVHERSCHDHRGYSRNQARHARGGAASFLLSAG